MSYKIKQQNLSALLKAFNPKFVVINCFDDGKRKEIADVVKKSIYAALKNVKKIEEIVDSDEKVVYAGKFQDAQALHDILEEQEDYIYIFCFLQPKYKARQPYKEHCEEFDGRMLTVIIE